MTLAFDALTSLGTGTGTLSATHTPVGTPRGAIVKIVTNGTTADQIDAVMYGSAAMTEATGSPHTNAASPGCSLHIFHLGTSIPTGAQTVSVTVTGAATKRAWVETVTGADDTTVVDTTAVDGAGIGSHTGTLSLGGVACYCTEVVWSNGNNTLRITQLSGDWSEDEVDFGSEVAGSYRYTIVDTADVTMGWSHDQADSGAALGIAIREGGGGGSDFNAAFARGSNVVIGAGNA